MRRLQPVGATERGGPQRRTRRESVRPSGYLTRDGSAQGAVTERAEGDAACADLGGCGISSGLATDFAPVPEPTLPSQRAMLLSLSNVVYSSPAQREVELWRVAKDGRELRCIAVYMPTGIDLRLMEGEDFRRPHRLTDPLRRQKRRNGSGRRRSGDQFCPYALRKILFGTTSS
jgi:hypothetical protein